MPILIDVRRLQRMTPLELRRECAKVEAEWYQKGRPAEEKMPRLMLAKVTALRVELKRRGQQLTLF